MNHVQVAWRSRCWPHDRKRDGGRKSHLAEIKEMDNKYHTKNNLKIRAEKLQCTNFYDSFRISRYTNIIAEISYSRHNWGVENSWQRDFFEIFVIVIQLAKLLLLLQSIWPILIAFACVPFLATICQITSPFQITWQFSTYTCASVFASTSYFCGNTVSILSDSRVKIAVSAPWT